ncbi:MAG: DNA-binding protein [Blautia sp.]|nr:helix-turn-helix domain-containing protein [Blautia sp.]MDY3997790.1 DNA-binding protein [Blautia sp.]
MKYLSTFETAEKWGISHRRVSILCNQKRIPGAQRAGSRWIIPEDAEKPVDARIKSGKYIKTKNEEGGIQ